MKRWKVNEVKKQDIPDPENIQFKLVPRKKKDNDKSLKRKIEMREIFPEFRCNCGAQE